MVINARNIFVCGTEKKRVWQYSFFFCRFSHYDFGSRGENENNHLWDWEKCVLNSKQPTNNSSAAQNLNIRFAFPMLIQWNVFIWKKSLWKQFPNQTDFIYIQSKCWNYSFIYIDFGCRKKIRNVESNPRQSCQIVVHVVQTSMNKLPCLGNKIE